MVFWSIVWFCCRVKTGRWEGRRGKGEGSGRPPAGTRVVLKGLPPRWEPLNGKEGTVRCYVQATQDYQVDLDDKDWCDLDAFLHNQKQSLCR